MAGLIWACSFNAHNTLWGSGKNDSNGEVVKEMLDGQNLVCVNDGRGTRIDVNTGKESDYLFYASHSFYFDNTFNDNTSTNCCPEISAASYGCHQFSIRDGSVGI